MQKQFNFKNVKIDLLNVKAVEHFLINYNYSDKGYICLPDFYTLSCANKSIEIRNALNHSILTLPDGKPIELLAKINGFSETETVSGFWLCKRLLNSNITHFFYGTNEPILEKIIKNIKNEFPNSKILGYKAPPQVELNNINANIKIDQDIKFIKELKPDIIWIGISSPKQDLLMHYFHNKLDRGIMIGIGGVFDYLAGVVKISPEWIKKLSLRWLYRFIQDPKRFFKKNLSNFSFLSSLILERFSKNIDISKK